MLKKKIKIIFLVIGFFLIAKPIFAYNSFSNNLINTISEKYLQRVEEIDSEVFGATAGSRRWVYTSNNQLLRPITNVSQVVIGDTSTTSATTILEVKGDTLFRGSINATSTSTSTPTFHTNELCIANDCKTVWPTGGTGASAWEYLWSGAITPTTTSAGIFVTASSTIQDSLRIDGSATTTGSHYIGGTASSSQLFIQGTGHFGSNLTVDGSITGLGNITGVTIYGDGSNLTNIGSAAASALTIVAKAAENVTKGQPVYFSGATGQFPQVSLADNTVQGKTSPIGLAAETKTTGQSVLIRIGGQLDGVDTSEWVDGDCLKLSTSGTLASTTPTSGTITKVAKVEYSHAVTGSLLVYIHRSVQKGAPATINLYSRLGDDIGGNKISYRNYSNSEVAYINSYGDTKFRNATTTGNLIVGNTVWDAPTSTFTVDGSIYATGNATTSKSHFFGDDIRTDRWAFDDYSTFLGIDVAGNDAITTAFYNTCIGNSAGYSLVDGYDNVFIGVEAGYTSTDGAENVFIGDTAGKALTSGYGNVGVGHSAGTAITSGYDNFILSYAGGATLTTGHSNILIGQSVDTPASDTSDFLNIGDTLYGNLSTNTIGIGITNPTSTLSILGDVDIIGSATTTATSTARGLKVENLINCDTVDTNAEGHFVCGTDETGAGGGDFAWTTTGYGQATSTILGFNVGFLSTASSTIIGNFRVDGNATSTGSFSAGQLLVNDTPLNIANWDTAHGWGDHSTAGYLTDINSSQFGQLSDVSTSTLVYGSLPIWDTSNWVSSSTWSLFESEWINYTNASSTIATVADITTDIATHLAVIADTNTIGHLNDTDWDTFNNKWDGLTDMVLTDNYIYVGDASNDPVGVAMSNDCAIASNGTITCDHDALDNFVANEHLDWTGDLGAVNIHAGNYTDTNTTYLGGTNLTLVDTTFNVDDKFIKNDANDTMVGTLTADGLTLGANENITLGSQTLDHNGTDFVFNDGVVITDNATTTGIHTIWDGTNGIRITPDTTTTTISAF